MVHELRDFQSAPLSIASDATEQTVYSFTVAANSITTATLHRCMFSGKVSSKASAPGTLTVRAKFGATTTIVLAETLNLSALNSGFVANLDCWVLPSGVIAVGGFFAQSGADLFAVAGSRSQSATGAVDLTVDNIFAITAQFSVADVGNVFTRSIASLAVMSG